MRSRNIKPGFFRNEHLATLPYETRLLFIGLWCLADKAGRVEDRPTKIKMQLFAADSIDIGKGLAELAGAGEPFIVRYVADDVPIIQVVNWERHQRPHHQEADSILPKFAPTFEPTSHHGAKTKVSGISNRVSAIRYQVSGIGDQESAVTPETVFECFVASNAAVKPKALSKARRAKLVTRLKVADWPWKDAITKLPIANTDTFTFQPDFDWLIKNDENARKLAEGRYDKRSGPKHLVSAGTRYDANTEGFGDGF